MSGARFGTRPSGPLLGMTPGLDSTSEEGDAAS